MKATFDGNSEKLAFFLNQVWMHVDPHGGEYADDEAWVDVIVTNLEGEMAEWVTTLHDERAPELANLDAFLCELRAWFSDPMETQRAESEVRKVKQGSRSITEYMREFRKISGEV